MEQNTRTEHDTLGCIEVPAECYWGAQTERSRRNFPAGAGTEPMPSEIIRAFAVLKKACAVSNLALCPDRICEDACRIIGRVCDEIADGSLNAHFPLVVFQTGSGTQTNMNVNEVIANRGNELAGRELLHPNDTVNLSQSSNDTFPSALRIAAVTSLESSLYPALEGLISELKRLETEYADVLKCGRTHLQDAVPMRFSQEISGWRTALEADLRQIRSAEQALFALALGGTAVGTGLNAPLGFDAAAAKEIAALTGYPFHPAENKFMALTSLDDLVFSHGAVKALAADLMKIANDIRWLASGPRLGLGEITIPENEPGSSIMPGKVNPTQCEAVTMVAVEVMGNDAAIGFAASQGNFELNVFLPVTAYNYLQSVRLLSDVIRSFTVRCVSGICPVRERMEENLNRTLMLATALSPVIGYEKAAETARLAHRESLSLREACLALGYLTASEFDEAVRPEKMIPCTTIQS